MFYKKRKEAEKQKRLAAFAQQEEAFAKEIGAVAEIGDPAAQVLKLTHIQSGIARYACETRRGTEQNNSNIGIFVGLPGAAMALASLPLMAAPHVGIPLFLYGGGMSTMVGSMFGQKVSDKRTSKARAAEAQSHLQKMEKLAKQATEMKETLVREQAQQISQSPLYEKILALPGLSERFAGVAAKRMAQLEAELAAEKKKNAAPAPAAKSARKPGNYDKFRGL